MTTEPTPSVSKAHPTIARTIEIFWHQKAKRPQAVWDCDHLSRKAKMWQNVDGWQVCRSALRCPGCNRHSQHSLIRNYNPHTMVTSPRFSGMFRFLGHVSSRGSFEWKLNCNLYRMYERNSAWHSRTYPWTALQKQAAMTSCSMANFEPGQGRRLVR